MNVDAAPAADRETAVDVRLRELMIAFVGFAIAAIVMTLPLWQHPTRRLPSDLVDTLLNTWIIGWDADRLRHGLVGLWDAPIYYPYRNTLAFSENLLGIAVLVAPVYWITGNPILTYNVALILSFAIAGVGMYLLATSLTRSRRSGVIAAAFYAFCSFRFIELSHIQFIATGWLPIALYGLHRYFSTGRRGYLGTFGVGCALQALSNSYVAYFMALPIASVALDGLRRERTRRAPAGGAGRGGRDDRRGARTGRSEIQSREIRLRTRTEARGTGGGIGGCSFVLHRAQLDGCVALAACRRTG